MSTLSIGRFAWFSLIALASACSPPPTPVPDATPDVVAQDRASMPDATTSLPDATAPLDAGETVETGVVADSGVGADADATVVSDAVSDTGAAPDARALSIKIAGTLDSGGISATQFRALLATRGTVTMDAAPTFNTEYFRGVDLVVFGNLPATLTLLEQEALGVYVAASRGRVLVLGGYEVGQAAKTHSVVRSFSMAVSTTAALLLTPPTEFMAGSMTNAGVTAAPPINGAYQFESVNGPLAAAEVRVIAAPMPWIAARYESGTGGKLFAWLDEWATLDPQMTDGNTRRFWGNVLDFLLR